MAQEEPGGQPVDWCLTDRYGQRQKLPKTMIFLGREECDIILQSETVDKRHAVVTFDHYLNKFKIKDLSTANGTYVNDTKITEQTYVTLEHLDSLRLGFDPNTYYVERMDKLGGGGLPAVIPQSKPPVWASRHLTHMAECKGCIAEQQIHHTCGGHVHADPRQLPTTPAHLTCGHQHDLNGLEDPSGYHTWPRKGEKLCKMRHTHQKEGQMAADQTNSSQCSDGLQDSCNSAVDSQFVQRHSVCTAADTDPRSHYPIDPEASYPGDPKTPYTVDPKAPYPSALSKPVMYIDRDSSRSLDSESAGSHFSQDHLDNGIMQPERDTNNIRKKDNLTDLKISSDAKSGSSGVNPRSSHTKRKKIIKDVDRVVKGTPLYGQPAWWGEEEKEGLGTKTDSSATQPKPLSDVRSLDSTTKPGADIDWGYDPQKYKSDPKYSQRYMEIPARDTDPDLESPVHPTMNNDSALSKDSLSPDGPPDNREVSVEKNSSSQPASKTYDTSAMAFTVDLGDEKPSKKMNMSGSLSEFVPSKIRRSFRERLEKASSKASQPVNKEELNQGEEREPSPTRQKKLEDLWGMAEEKVSKKPKTPRQSVGKAGGDGRLSGEEDGGLREEKIAQNTTLKKASKPSDRKSPKGKQPFDSSTFTKVKPGSAKVRSDGVSAEVPMSDPASFLIDKMFESSTCKQSRSEEEMIPQVTEHALYKESSIHDADFVRKSSRLPKAQQDLAYLKLQKSGQEPLVSVSKVRGQRGKENVIDAEEGDDVGEEVDKTSEAGTYTIELDNEAQAEEEEQEARQSIDHIFGISRDGLNRPVVDEGETFHRSDVNHDDSSEEQLTDDHLEQVEEDLDKLEWQRADGGLLSSMEVEVGSGYDSRQQQQPADKAKLPTLDAPQTLIKQRTFLKEDGCHSSPDGNKSSSSKDSLNSMSPSDRPPSGHQKKRPGTGRKLPSLPSGSPRSDPSPRLSDIMQRTRDFSPKGENSAVRKEKSVTISSQVVTHNGKMDSSRSGSTSDITLTNVSSLSSDLPETTVKPSKSESARSLASIDTEILLRDTETVMAAMEARMVSRRQAEECNQDFYSNCDSDTDVSSTIAVVNEVPESSAGKRRQAGSKLISQRLAEVKGQKVKPKPVQKQDSVPKLRESPVSAASLGRKLSLPCDTDRSLVSDVLSDNDSISVRSDASTDYSETSSQPSRKGSKGKGTITMTRPNRAFQLRRLRAEGSTESPDNTKSESSSVCTSTPKSTSRPVSGRSMSRPNSTGASDHSLGAAIAKKGKQNSANSQQNFTRTDGGRYSLRSTRSATSTSSSKSSASGSSSTTKTATPEAARKKELRDLKSHLKNKHDLTVTGVSKSRSQPPSRSNSPKTQERNAWKRRKEYDPRKAVAEAKANKARAVKASSNPPPAVTKTKRPTPEKGASKMNRSASYTNTEDFNKFGRESMGDSMSSDDLSSALQEEATDNFNESGFQRAFQPRGAQSMTSVRDHCGQSGDENSSSLSEESTDLPLSYGMLSLRPYKSAFTPPPKSRSPASPPLSPPFRRANNSHDLYSARSVPGLVHRHTDLHTQSYDSLIISSIYQLSLKLKTSTDRTLEKLRDNRRVSGSPSPVFELGNQPTSSEIPAWNAANQELAAILKNLRKMDHRMQVINKALFPGEEGGTESARLTSREKKQYLQEIQRIHELAGFRPIENPEQVWKMTGEEETEDIDDNTSNVSEIEDFVDEEYY